MLYDRDRRIIADAMETGEPVIVFRAKDLYATSALRAYLYNVAGACDNDFVKAVNDRLREFDEWRGGHADLLKVPDLRPEEPM